MSFLLYVLCEPEGLATALKGAATVWTETATAVVKANLPPL